MAKTVTTKPLNPQRVRIRREFSAGGIVFKDKGKVLLIQSRDKKYWSFPKGHIEVGQTSREAAVREVEEEGGIKAGIIDKVGDSRYIFTLHGEKIFKVVIFFAMKYLSGDPKDHDWEVNDARWFSVEEALKSLSFKKDKELLQKAREMIQQGNLPL